MGEHADFRFGPVQAQEKSPELVGGDEAVAYFLAHVIKIGLVSAITFTGATIALYRWSFQFDRALGQVVQIGLSAAWALVAFFCFLILRGLFGATPARIGGASGRRTIGTNGEEFGAYALAAAIWVIFFMLIGSPLFIYLRTSQPQAGAVLGYVIPVIGSIVVFVIFILLRRAFSGGAPNPTDAWSRPQR